MSYGEGRRAIEFAVQKKNPENSRRTTCPTGTQSNTGAMGAAYTGAEIKKKRLLTPATQAPKKKSYNQMQYRPSERNSCKLTNWGGRGLSRPAGRDFEVLRRLERGWSQNDRSEKKDNKRKEALGRCETAASNLRRQGKPGVAALRTVGATGKKNFF